MVGDYMDGLGEAISFLIVLACIGMVSVVLGLLFGLYKLIVWII